VWGPRRVEGRKGKGIFIQMTVNPRLAQVIIFLFGVLFGDPVFTDAELTSSEMDAQFRGPTQNQCDKANQ
jgi:hypothetical protein